MNEQALQTGYAAQIGELKDRLQNASAAAASASVASTSSRHHSAAITPTPVTPEGLIPHQDRPGEFHVNCSFLHVQHLSSMKHFLQSDED